MFQNILITCVTCRYVVDMFLATIRA